MGRFRRDVQNRHMMCCLRGRGGVYGPFLELAKVSEGEDGVFLAEQAGLLGISAEQFNRAQMEALAFAEAMDL